MINFLLGVSVILNILLLAAIKIMGSKAMNEIKTEVKAEYEKKHERENADKE